jgi:hypothetical protein
LRRRSLDPAFLSPLSMLHLRGRLRVTLHALAMLAAALTFAGQPLWADDSSLLSSPASQLGSSVSPLGPPPSQLPPEPAATATPGEPTTVEPTPDEKADDSWSILPKGDAAEKDDHIVRFDQPPAGEPMAVNGGDEWTAQWVPTGIIYHSYMAGPHEPRSSLFIFSDVKQGGALADASLGGRMGFWRYGNNDAVHPEGFQIDFYGAALARLDLEQQEDLNSCDYVFGLPFTYGNEVWQVKFGYSHLSSHLGDEYAISHPGSLGRRINYSRDSAVLGGSYYPVPTWRVYGEVGLAAQRDDHAGPFTSQFGAEWSRPGPTRNQFVPFFAINGRLRNDDGMIGDMNIQTGWLQRGILGQTLRFGFDYYGGKSDQSQFFNQTEHQIGAGVWYDF